MRKIKQLLLSTFIIAVLFSCTVEKRIYSSGYHVEWSHKKQGSVKESKTINEEEMRVVESKLDVEENLIQASIHEQSNEKQDEVAMESIDYSSSTKKTMSKNTFQLVPKLLANENRNTEMNSFIQKKENSPNNAPESSGRMSGVYLLLLALLFLLLAFVFYTYLGVIGMVFAVIFGIAAAALLIYGIIKIIIG